MCSTYGKGSPTLSVKLLYRQNKCCCLFDDRRVCGENAQEHFWEQFKKRGHWREKQKLKPEQSFSGLHHPVIVIAAVFVAQKCLCALIDTAAGHPDHH